MDKSIRIVVSMLLASSLALTACQGQSAPKSDEKVEDAADQGSKEISGGWVTNEDIPATVLTDDERDVFERAMEGLVGVGYEPVRTLATQVVAGTNYAFLCLGTTVTAEPEAAWYVVAAYEDLEGNASLNSAEAIDLANVSIAASASGENLVGGWTLATPDGGSMLPAAAQRAFGEAYTDGGDVSLSPLVLLGTQLVSGTNYKILCDGTAVDGTRSLYVVDVYEDLEGNASITGEELFDLLAYV